MQVDYEDRLKLKWTSMAEYENEEQLLSDMIDYFMEQKEPYEEYKKELDGANADIKFLMNKLGMKEFTSSWGYTAKLNVQKRESFDDNKLITKLKELGVTTPIKTVEVVDMDELENVIYNGGLDASQLTGCKQIKEIPVLKVSKKKGE